MPYEICNHDGFKNNEINKYVANKKQRKKRNIDKEPKITWSIKNKKKEVENKVNGK